MKSLITEYLDIWTSAKTQKANVGRGHGNGSNGNTVYGIKKFRELILELAVRGKLVEQDPNDEPASILLEKIEKDKNRLFRDGKIKKQKSLTSIITDEKLFELPKGWVWAKLGNLSNDIHYGYTASANQNIKNVRLLRITDIQNDRVDWNSVPGCIIEKAKVIDYQLEDGDVLIARTGGTIGKSYLVNDIQFCSVFASYLIRIRRNKKMYPEFIKTYLGSQLYWNQLYSSSMGTGQPNVNGNALKNLIFPLPPLAEQHRIVAKVDELMELCDQLEKQQTENTETHRKLVETLLSTLTSAADHKGFSETWKRIVKHFDILFTTEESIDLLQQTILQLAVMGKLVEQNSEDEPASELLKKIAKEKELLIKQGKIKKQKPLPEISEDEKPFVLPDGWEWARIGDASMFTEYGLSEKTYDIDDGVPVIKMGDIQDGKVILGGQKKVAEDVEGLPNLYLHKNDLLYNRTNSAELVGKTGIYKGPDNFYTFASYLVRIRGCKKYIKPAFINLAMNSKYFRITQIEPHLKQQCGQANVNATIMKNMIIPVPPIKEQSLILAKVEELLGFCGFIKSKLIELQNFKANFADTMVEHVIS